MKKAIAIIILGLLFSGNAYALSQYMAEFTQWLSDNGYSEYVGAKPDWSKCSGDKTASFDYIPLFCYGKDGKLLSKNEIKIIDKEWKRGKAISYNAKARNKYLDEFNQWLLDNGHHQHLNLPEICITEPKLTSAWLANSCDKFQVLNNLNIKFYKSSSIPEKTRPNDDTLTYYLWIYLNKHTNNHLIYSVTKPSETPYKFKFDIKEDKYIQQQLKKTALLSYLLFEDGKIVIDEIAPKEKFFGMFRNDTRYKSQSNGKSIAAYILGHAVCKGYIESVDLRLNDWPILENTLYYDQKIIDLLNMNAGDHKYVKSNSFFNSKRNITYPTIKMTMKNELKNSKKSRNKFNYSGLPPHIILNYMIFKIGDEKFEQLLNEIFTNKVKTEYSSFFFTVEAATSYDRSLYGALSVTRYDYLRIAKAMLDDWQNDTCEGKFLKDIFNKRIKKTAKYVNDRKNHKSLSKTREYAGFFHTGYSGMKDRPVMGMDGHGGQSILIDFEKGRIVATMAVHFNYNWKKIVYDPIKKGK